MGQFDIFDLCLTMWVRQTPVVKFFAHFFQISAKIVN